MTPAPHVKGKLSDGTRQELVKAMLKHLIALHAEGGGKGAGAAGGQQASSPSQSQSQPQQAQQAQPQQAQAHKQTPQQQQAMPQQQQATQMPQAVHVIHHVAPHHSGSKGK